VNKSGNSIELTIGGCNRVGSDSNELLTPEMTFTRTADGYSAHVEVTVDQNSNLYMYDLMGRVVMDKQLYLQAGINDFEIPAIGSGIFVVELRGDLFTDTKKLFF
jgi:hypothetical protein